MDVHEPQVDFVIVTALEEERDAVLNKLAGYQQLAPAKEHIYTYFEATLPVTLADGATGVYRLIVVLLSGMGRVQATLATREAIRKWRPRYVLLVGIAGGVKARGVALGDVLISEQIVDYELQKITGDEPQIRWQVHRADPRLLDASLNFIGTEWHGLIETKRPVSGSPRRHIGPIASGDKVIAFGEVLDKYRDKWPMLIGVEMEAAGAAAAAFQDPDRPGFLMIRSVSDLADQHKGSAQVKKWRSYACNVAAAYAIGFLKNGPVVPQDAKQPYEPEMIRIRAGNFWMGSPIDDNVAAPNEMPRHKVHLPTYSISRYPITNAQYAQFVLDGCHAAPLHWENGEIPEGQADHPVTQVSYEDAEAFCEWLKQISGKPYRLPQETEWEKAARGGSPQMRRYPWGNDQQSGVCNTQEIDHGGTTSVHEYELINKSPFGVIDMVGNVWEWTSTWYAQYPGTSHSSGVYGVNYRVVRGGSWKNSLSHARISCRGRYQADVQRAYVGFRIALDE